MKMRKFNSRWYTKGRFGKGFREINDIDNEFLYARGRYPTKIRKEDLPEDYVEFRSRSIWYLTGYLKTSGVKDLYYSSVKINHLFKDDYLDISFSGELKIEKDKYGCESCHNYDFTICGNDIIPVLFAIEKNSDVDTTEVRKRIAEKFEWWRKNYKEDYIRCFESRGFDDIFDYFKAMKE